MRGICLTLTLLLGACAHQPWGRVDSFNVAFDLLCKPIKEGQPDLLVHFVPIGNDQVIAQRMGATELVDYTTGTYENAVRWKSDTATYVVDRFTGKLAVEPSKEVYFCSRQGRRVF